MRQIRGGIRGAPDHLVGITPEASRERVYLTANWSDPAQKRQL